ncbi:MAG: precorrin-6A reductase [Lachnospiraceae bacterium]|nr:precorrin-6A reductase [Lachnospiraceae bacterium]MDY5742199.1 precorrin-6A reductase [Lachnospiraceae bacterium]
MKQFEQQPKLLVFAGTTEGRQLAEFLEQQQIPALISVATEYGSEVLASTYNYIRILEGRMQEEDLICLLGETGISHLIDATHPFAKAVTEMLQRICDSHAIRYDRLLRAEDGEEGDEIFAGLDEVVESLRQRPGRIMATTGSKEAAKYAALPDFDSRVWIRVLPSLESIGLCREAGFSGKQIIAMQGPFSKELNKSLMQEYGIDYLITKQSGRTGGVDEKIAAARELGVRVLSIGRPKESGLSFAALCEQLQKQYTFGRKHMVSIVSLGMGSAAGLTGEAVQTLQASDLLIGAERMIRSLQEESALCLAEKPGQFSYRPAEIIRMIEESRATHVSVVMSGDVGFYSGAKKLLAAIKETHPDWQTDLISGLSSPVYLLGRLGRPWQDVALHSLHGTGADFASLVRRSKRSFYLLEEGDLRPFIETLEKLGATDALLAYGSRLSYPDEAVRIQSVAEWQEELVKQPHCLEVAMPAVLYVEWEKQPPRPVIPILTDEDFIRSEVPMTKEEIRTLSIAKLGATADSVVFDIGAGTGSVSIQLAKTVYAGQVVAIERHAKAVELIQANKEKHGCANLTVIEGRAPLSDEQTAGLPKPTHVFIGGSAGSMDDIIDWCLRLNPAVTFVWNAITLESVTQITTAIRRFELAGEDISLVQVSKDKKVAGYHMMMGQNPIYIIRAKGVSHEV